MSVNSVMGEDRSIKLIPIVGVEQDNANENRMAEVKQGAEAAEHRLGNMIVRAAAAEQPAPVLQQAPANDGDLNETETHIAGGQEQGEDAGPVAALERDDAGNEMAHAEHEVENAPAQEHAAEGLEQLRRKDVALLA